MHRVAFAQDTSRRIPLTIIGGPRQSGKTTLLRRLLTRNDGRRIAVLLDHPAALGLGDSIATRASGDALVLPNGSACLALDGDVLTALPRIHDGPPSALPDHVLVESSLSTSPLRTLGYEFLPGFRAGGTIVVVSAPDVERDMVAEPGAGAGLHEQLKCADVLVLNQVDLVSVVARKALRRWLRERAPRARLVECERCNIPAPMLLGASLAQAPAHAVHGEWSPRYAIDGASRRAPLTQPRHEEDYRAWLLHARAPLDASTFGRWVDALPDSVLHGDGLLMLRGDRGHRVRFHLCGSRWTLSPEMRWEGEEAEPGWISLVGLPSASRVVTGARRTPGSLETT